MGGENSGFASGFLWACLAWITFDAFTRPRPVVTRIVEREIVYVDGHESDSDLAVADAQALPLVVIKT